MSAPIVFNNIWFTPRRKFWNLKLFAYDDTGTLVILGNSLEFHGNTGVRVIHNISKISFGKHGRDFVNNWVIVDYLDGESKATACFADGNNLGWEGVLGGTRKIYETVTAMIVTAR